MDNNLERAMGAVKDALKYLEREHERYREAKLASDERVHDFKYENHLIGIEQQANVTMAKLQQLQIILTEIETTRIQV
jgi:capsule polysaccharide export protein KpsE/RkpR